MSISEAVSALKDTLAAEGFRAGIVEEFAEEYDVKVPLLARKFQEATGRTPEEFKVVDMKNALRLAAVRAAAKAQADAEYARKERAAIAEFINANADRWAKMF